MPLTERRRKREQEMYQVKNQGIGRSESRDSSESFETAFRTVYIDETEIWPAWSAFWPIRGLNC